MIIIMQTPPSEISHCENNSLISPWCLKYQFHVRMMKHNSFEIRDLGFIVISTNVFIWGLMRVLIGGSVTCQASHYVHIKYSGT